MFSIHTKETSKTLYKTPVPEFLCAVKQPPTILHSLLYNIPKTVLINYEMGKREIKSDSLPPDKEKKTQKKKKKKSKIKK